MTHLKKSLLGLLLANPVSFSFAQENQYTQAENIKQATEYAKTFKGEFKEFPEFGLGQSTRYRILEKSGWTGPAQTQEPSPKSISQVTPETGGGYPLPPIPFQFNAQVGQAVSKTLPFLAELRVLSIPSKESYLRASSSMPPRESLLENQLSWGHTPSQLSSLASVCLPKPLWISP